MTLALSAALLGLLTLGAIYRLLVQAGRGERFITLSRACDLPPEEAWRRLNQAWENTCLTFRRVDRIENLADGSRAAYTLFRNRPRVIRVRALAGLPHGRLGMSVAGGSGQKLDEIWTIEASGAASRVTVEIRAKVLWLAIPLLILAARSRLRLFAVGAHDYAQAPGQGAVSAATPPRAQPKPAPITGFNPSDYTYEILISLLAFASFVVQFDMASAIQLTAVILLHEYGHLLAYQLTGKKGNRMMLVPFMGGIAVSSSEHRSEFERAVCALAGPAICVPLSIVAFAYSYFAEDYSTSVEWATGIAYFSCLLNALNLLPIFPLDGSQVAEGYLRSFVRGSLLPLMLILSLVGLMVLVYLDYKQMALLIGLIGLPRLLRRADTPSMQPMSARESAIIGVAFAITALTHGGIYYIWWIA